MLVTPTYLKHFDGTPSLAAINTFHTWTAPTAPLQSSPWIFIRNKFKNCFIWLHHGTLLQYKTTGQSILFLLRPFKSHFFATSCATQPFKLGVLSRRLIVLEDTSLSVRFRTTTLNIVYANWHSVFTVNIQFLLNSPKLSFLNIEI